MPKDPAEKYPYARDGSEDSKDPFELDNGVEGVQEQGLGCNWGDHCPYFPGKGKHMPHFPYSLERENTCHREVFQLDTSYSQGGCLD